MNFLTLTQLFTHYGYIIIFPIAILEGPVISILSGFFVSLKLFNPYLVFFILVMGDLVGDSLYYIFGRYSGKWFLNHFGKYLGATSERIIFLEKHFRKHDWKILLFGKTQAVGSILLFVAGTAKVSYLRFISYNAIGTIPKTILFMVVGFYFGKTYSTSSKYFDYFSFIWLFISVMLIVVYLYVKNYIKKSAFKDNNNI